MYVCRECLETTAYRIHYTIPWWTVIRGGTLEREKVRQSWGRNRNHRSSDIRFFCLGGGCHEKARNVISQEDTLWVKCRIFSTQIAPSDSKLMGEECLLLMGCGVKCICYRLVISSKVLQEDSIYGSKTNTSLQD